MALDGGSGGGPLSSSNPFTGVANTLEFIGNGIWAAWTGVNLLNDGTGALDALAFTSPGVSLNCEFQTYLDTAPLTEQNKGVLCNITFNGVQVIRSKVTISQNQSEQETPFWLPMKVVIPAFTEVVVTYECNDAGGARFSGTLVGTEI